MQQLIQCRRSQLQRGKLMPTTNLILKSMPLVYNVQDFQFFMAMTMLQ
jgi:hypothetical protein